MKLPVITNSQMKCFRRCAREHHFAYELGYRSAHEEEALHFGDLIHKGLEAWWNAHRRGDGGRALAEAEALEAIDGQAADDFLHARAAVMLQGYDARWAPEMEHYEVLAVEDEFRAPLRNPATGAPSRTFDLGGKLDAVVRDRRDGLVKLVEHKTSSDDITLGSDYWKRLQLDPQVSTYFAGARSLGFEIGECIYDVLGKPALRPGSIPVTDADGVKVVLDQDGVRVRTKDGKRWRQTADKAAGYELQTRPERPEEYRQRLLEHFAVNPERYYQRGTVVRLDTEEADAAHDAWATARLIREAELAGRHPRNPDACVRFGRTCTYFDVCSGSASLDDATRFRKVERVHEELTEAA